jgi:hypothetical protein
MAKQRARSASARKGRQPSVNHIGRFMGSMEAQMAANTSAIANLAERWQTNDDRAAEGRRIMYEKIDGISRDVQRLTSSVDQVGGRVSSVEAWRTSIENWIRDRDAERNQVIGGFKVGRWFALKIAAVISAILAAVGIAGYGAIMWALPRIANGFGF